MSKYTIKQDCKDYDTVEDLAVAIELAEQLLGGVSGGGAVDVPAGGALTATVPAHGVEVYLLDAPVTDPSLKAALEPLRNRRVAAVPYAPPKPQ